MRGLIHYYKIQYNVKYPQVIKALLVQSHMYPVIYILILRALLNLTRVISVNVFVLALLYSPVQGSLRAYARPVFVPIKSFKDSLSDGYASGQWQRRD